MMSASSHSNRWHLTKKGKFRCLQCSNELSSKQRVVEHLYKIHDFSPAKREKKRYLDDNSVPVPRSTSYRWKKQKDGTETEISTRMSLDFVQRCDASAQEQIPGISQMPLESIHSVQCDPVSTPKKQLISKHLPESNYSPEHCNVTEYPDLDKNMSSNDFSLDEDVCRNSTLNPDEFSDMCHSDLNTSFEKTSDNSSETGLSGHSGDTESRLSDSSSDTDISEDTTSSSESSSQTDLEHDEAGKEIPVKEFQSLSLLSCFLRNQFSACSSQDVIQTLKDTFKECEDISRLNFNEMMSYADIKPIRDVHYCVLCNEIFPENEDIFHCSTPNCEGLRYKGALSSQQMKSRQPNQSFVFADVKQHLVDFLQTPGIWEEIEDRKKCAYERFESGANTLNDITDGTKYREMMKKGGFLDKDLHNITGIFNTDGLNLYSSSKVELWPIFLAINELSPPKRFSRDNILLVGIWQGKGKPPFEPFFKIFSEYMNSLYNDGVQIKVNKDVFNVKLAVLWCVFYLPAKAELMNMSYFNGQYPCIKCEESGMTVRQGKGTAKCFPHRLPEARSADRKHEMVLTNMRTGSAKNRSKGFKGMSGLVNLAGFDLVVGVVPEYMHGVLLGVTKALLNKWFSPSQSGKECFIGKHLKAISHRMKRIKPPDGIERLPRDLEKHYNHFKATELQSWLLYYAYPCVKGFLKEEYMENLLCLSEGIHILLRDQISQELLDTAADLLDQFYASFQHLYGDGSCGLNVHNAGQHLVEYVQFWGPLWCWSTFPFEDNNAMILEAVHGTGLVSKQIMKYRQAQACIRKKGLNKKKTNGWKITHNAINCHVAGALKQVKIDEIDMDILEQLTTLHDIDQVNSLKRLDRIIVNEKRFYSEQYVRMRRRLCTIVLYGNNSVGCVKYFILCDDVAYGVIEKMEKNPLSQVQLRASSHFIPVRYTGTLILVNVEQLQEIIILLHTGTTEPIFVVRMPNSYGHAVFK